MMGVWLPAQLHAQILHEARTAHPRECCGLIEGLRGDGGFRVAALHPARNLAADADRVDIDPRDHLAAAKAARAHGRAVIGCYHSHPDGLARPSARDLGGAGEENFLWLIAAGVELAGFVYAHGGFAAVDCTISPV
jgi:desampylase